MRKRLIFIVATAAAIMALTASAAIACVPQGPSQNTYIFEGSCDDQNTTVAFIGGGAAAITVNGVQTNYGIPVAPQPGNIWPEGSVIDLKGVEGTILVQGVGDSRTATIDYSDC